MANPVLILLVLPCIPQLAFAALSDYPNPKWRIDDPKLFDTMRKQVGARLPKALKVITEEPLEEGWFFAKPLLSYIWWKSAKAKRIETKLKNPEKLCEQLDVRNDTEFWYALYSQILREVFSNFEADGLEIEMGYLNKLITQVGHTIQYLDIVLFCKFQGGIDLESERAREAQKKELATQTWDMLPNAKFTYAPEQDVYQIIGEEVSNRLPKLIPRAQIKPQEIVVVPACKHLEANRVFWQGLVDVLMQDIAAEIKEMKLTKEAHTMATHMQSLGYFIIVEFCKKDGQKIPARQTKALQKWIVDLPPAKSGILPASTRRKDPNPWKMDEPDLFATMRMQVKLRMAKAVSVLAIQTKPPKGTENHSMDGNPAAQPPDDAKIQEVLKNPKAACLNLDLTRDAEFWMSLFPQLAVPIFAARATKGSFAVSIGYLRKLTFQIGQTINYLSLVEFCKSNGIDLESDNISEPQRKELAKLAISLLPNAKFTYAPDQDVYKIIGDEVNSRLDGLAAKALETEKDKPAEMCANIDAHEKFWQGLTDKLAMRVQAEVMADNPTNIARTLANNVFSLAYFVIVEFCKKNGVDVENSGSQKHKKDLQKWNKDMPPRKQQEPGKN